MQHDNHNIVIVGGGAGGLELATRLGNRHRRQAGVHVTLVDRADTHLWKPLLHEVAAGSMDLHKDQLDYLAQARWHHFTFCNGAMDGLDRMARTVSVAPLLDANGIQVIPRRILHYDTLVIAIGSVTNTFGVRGVEQNAHMLDSADDAERFHKELVNACLRANHNVAAQRELPIVIVGGGATGVELAAELHNTTRALQSYGLTNFHPERDIRITLVNAEARILSALPEYLSTATTDVLTGLGVSVVNGEAAVEVLPDSVVTSAGKRIPALLTVWAAGIKAPAFLKEIDGLETNRLNQLVVLPTLQSTRDADIFALGDCAACPWPGHDGRSVPPRAQAAHQQATHLFHQIQRRFSGKALTNYRYRDFGSLVSLGKYSTVGNLMGFITGGSIRLEGLFARLMYVSLYKLHLLALHGFYHVALDTLGRFVRRRTEPRVKLH